MKILCFGSLNYDHTYHTSHFCEPKETLLADQYHRSYGGKGLNQAIALSKAGLDVYLAGKVGRDGRDLLDYANAFGVNTDYVLEDDLLATGHAIIEVSNAENRIILHGGANQAIGEEDIDEVLRHFDKGDVLLIQNEISNLDKVMIKANYKGLKIVFNIAPFDEKVAGYPMKLVDLIFVNEVEGAALVKDPKADLATLVKKISSLDKEVVMTVGAKGSYYIKGNDVIHQDAYPVEAVDTTAAGDTFTGFFLSSYLKGESIEEALSLAAKASSLTVTRPGAAISIPSIDEVR
ncbi:MAG: ribokinase [Erysipelotrichaceae bacterium]|nr:ribokinase [Erysipelotrichaceae bacterium]